MVFVLIPKTFNTLVIVGTELTKLQCPSPTVVRRFITLIINEQKSIDAFHFIYFRSYINISCKKNMLALHID